MTRFSNFLALILVVVTALPASASDQDKAKKELDKITAMATDPTGRRIVNLSMADVLNVKRFDLLMERRNNEINYGSLFLMHQLMLSGGNPQDVAQKLKNGKTIYQVADENHPDWKKVYDQAKTLNSKIDENLYKHFSADPKEASAKEAAEDEAANYNIIYDGVKADSDVSQSEMERAQDRYLAWKNRGEEALKRAGRLNTADRNAAYRDNVRSGGPSHGVGSDPPSGVH